MVQPKSDQTPAFVGEMLLELGDPFIYIYYVALFTTEAGWHNLDKVKNINYLC